jgi:hypothetical protein
MTDDDNKLYVKPSDDWWAGKEVKEGHKLYAFLVTDTQEDYYLVGPFADYTAMRVWGDVESQSNWQWQSVELPANFVPHLHAPDFQSEVGFVELSIPATANPVSNERKPYILCVRDDHYFLVGPFKNYAALGVWCDEAYEDKYDSDPRYHPIILPGDLLPQLRGPDWHPPGPTTSRSRRPAPRKRRSRAVAYIIMVADTAWLVGPFADMDAAGDWARANVDERTPGWRDWQAVEMEVPLCVYAPTDPKAVGGPDAA